MVDLDTKRPVLEAMFRKISDARDGVAFKGMTLRPLRGTTIVSATASFDGPFDRDVVIDMSEEIGDIVVDGTSIGWPWAERTEAHRAPRGFIMHVDFDVASRPC